MTEKGLAKLKTDLESWKDRRPQVAADVARFREMGDLRENAEYHAAREELAMIDAKVAQLESKIHSADIIRGEASADTVVFGTRVTVQESGARKSEAFDLVGEGETDAAQNKILTTSPLAQSLLTKKVGDTAEFKGPRKTVKFKILKIEPLG